MVLLGTFHTEIASVIRHFLIFHTCPRLCRTNIFIVFGKHIWIPLILSLFILLICCENRWVFFSSTLLFYQRWLISSLMSHRPWSKVILTLHISLFQLLYSWNRKYHLHTLFVCRQRFVILIDNLWRLFGYLVRHSFWRHLGSFLRYSGGLSSNYTIYL